MQLNIPINGIHLRETHFADREERLQTVVVQGCVYGVSSQELCPEQSKH